MHVMPEDVKRGESLEAFVGMLDAAIGHIADSRHHPETVTARLFDTSVLALALLDGELADQLITTHGTLTGVVAWAYNLPGDELDIWAEHPALFLAALVAEECPVAGSDLAATLADAVDLAASGIALEDMREAAKGGVSRSDRERIRAVFAAARR